VVRGIHARLCGEETLRSRLSLARTAKLLMDSKADIATKLIERRSEADLTDAIEMTPWGAARRVAPPGVINGAAMYWDRPAAELGSGVAEWL
jgi:hypothetical protein